MFSATLLHPANHRCHFQASCIVYANLIVFRSGNFPRNTRCCFVTLPIKASCANKTSILSYKMLMIRLIRMLQPQRISKCSFWNTHILVGKHYSLGVSQQWSRWSWPLSMAARVHCRTCVLSNTCRFHARNTLHVSWVNE